MRYSHSLSSACLMAALFAGLTSAQGTLEDYRRGRELQTKAGGLVVNLRGTPNGIAGSNHFWYYRAVTGGTEFLLVDAVAAAKTPAFDHGRLAAAITTASGGNYTGLQLPFAPAPAGRGRTAAGRGGATPAADALTFLNNETSIQFGASGFLYRCDLTAYTCSKGDPLPAPTAGGRGAAPFAENDSLAAPPREGGDPADGLEYEPPSPQDGGGRVLAGRGQPVCGTRVPTQTQNGVGRGGRGGRGGAPPPPAAGQADTAPQVCTSFDGKWDALIQNYNVFLRPAGTTQPATPLSYDGSEGNYYTLRSLAWSPDSQKFAAYHTRPGYARYVNYIESSPADQVQPKRWTIATKPLPRVFGDLYRKPGDALDVATPVLFDVAARKETEIDHALFPNAYSLSPPVWWKDSRAFTFEYNQRGHQLYRVIEVDGQTGKARALIEELSKTFIYYNNLGPGLSGGRKYRHDINDGKEIIWASERDGWEHLYLYDGVTGKVKSQITKGDWLVRNVDRVDDDARQIWFEAGGMVPGQDPYFTQFYRINFDGSGLTRFTEADGNHTVTFSPDKKFYVDSWSRVDLPTVAQLRRTDDQKVVMDFDKGDATALLASGVKFPEVCVAKGLFHPEFYKVVVTNSGCHDNRMDKLWWNEQWMGWPLGPEYAASSNVDIAHLLQGKALIIVGEMDDNVDPASSLQVVNALVKAKKHSDMLFIPGQAHGVGKKVSLPAESPTAATGN